MSMGVSSDKCSFLCLYIHVYQLQNQINNLNLGRVNSEMFCEPVLSVVSFAALVAPEGLFPRVRHHMPLHMTGCNAGVVALVTLVWLFSCMATHHVRFQITCCVAGKVAHFTSVRLFSRVGPFVFLQSD